MNVTITTLTLAARDVQWIWPKDTLDPKNFTWILVAMGLFLAVRWAMAIVRAARRRAHPFLLFNRVAARVGVSPGDRLWLYRLGRRQKLPTAMTLLLSPATLDHHAAEAAAGLNPRAAAGLRTRADAIRNAIFGEGALPRELHDAVHPTGSGGRPA